MDSPVYSPCSPDPTFVDPAPTAKREYGSGSDSDSESESRKRRSESVVNGRVIKIWTAENEIETFVDETDTFGDVAERVWFIMHAPPYATRVVSGRSIAWKSELFPGDAFGEQSDMRILSPDLDPIASHVAVLYALKQHPEWANRPFHRATLVGDCRGVGCPIVVQCTLFEKQFKPLVRLDSCDQFIPHLAVVLIDAETSNIDMTDFFWVFWFWKLGRPTVEEPRAALRVYSPYNEELVISSPKITRTRPAKYDDLARKGGIDYDGDLELDGFPRKQLFAASEKRKKVGCELYYVQIAQLFSMRH
jgi:hypothetical protein